MWDGVLIFTPARWWFLPVLGINPDWLSFPEAPPPFPLYRGFRNVHLKSLVNACFAIRAHFSKVPPIPSHSHGRARVRAGFFHRSEHRIFNRGGLHISADSSFTASSTPRLQKWTSGYFHKNHIIPVSWQMGIIILHLQCTRFSCFHPKTCFLKPPVLQ